VLISIRNKLAAEYDSHGWIISTNACGAWIKVWASGLAVPYPFVDKPKLNPPK